MKDDTSAIDSTACNVLYRSDTLYSYSQGVRRTFVENGGKWYYQGSTTYGVGPDSASCIDVSELSSYAFMWPVYYSISAIMVFVSVWMFFGLIRRLVRWR